MVKKLYAVRDLKGQSYSSPMVEGHDAVAIRYFGEACQNPDSMMGKYPDDFELHCLGSFDESWTGSVDNLFPIVGEKPRVVVTASAIMAALAAGPQRVKEA